MPHDVFISYARENKDVANALCHAMEAAGLRCWIAPRDVKGDMLNQGNFAAAIRSAIDECRLMVIIFSEHANKSRYVQGEINMAFNRNIPLVPFRVHDVKPSNDIELYLATSHWLDAFPPPVENHFADTIEYVHRFLGLQSEQSANTRHARAMPIPATDLRGRVFFNNGWDGFDPSKDDDVLFLLDLMNLHLVRHIEFLRQLRPESYHSDGFIAAKPQLMLDPLENEARLGVCFGSSDSGHQNETEYHLFFHNYRPIVPESVALDILDGNEEATWKWSTKLPSEWLIVERPYIREIDIKRIQRTLQGWVDAHNTEISRIRNTL